MKKTLIAIVACLFLCGGNAMAQKNVKLGHINSNDLMQIMPGRDSAQTILQQEVAGLEEQLKSMQSEMEKRYNEYMEKQSGWTELIRNTKQRELQDMGTRIQEFQENAQKQLQQREQDLLNLVVLLTCQTLENGRVLAIYGQDGSMMLYCQTANQFACHYQCLFVRQSDGFALADSFYGRTQTGIADHCCHHDIYTRESDHLGDSVGSGPNFDGHIRQRFLQLRI